LKQFLGAFGFLLEPGGMHLCGSPDVILPLLFATEAPAFPTLLKR
jgi:hypothetical protein